MKVSKNVLTTKNIKNLNLSKNDTLGFEYYSNKGINNYYLLSNCKRIVSFTDSKNRLQTYNKIQKMGLGLGVLEIRNPQGLNGI